MLYVVLSPLYLLLFFAGGGQLVCPLEPINESWVISCGSAVGAPPGIMERYFRSETRASPLLSWLHTPSITLYTVSVMYLRLPVFYFVIGKVITTIRLAHVIDGESLTLRIIILEACLGISGMVASIIGGEWLKAQRYSTSFL